MDKCPTVRVDTLTEAAEMGQGPGCCPGRPGAKVGSGAGDGDVGGGN